MADNRIYRSRTTEARTMNMLGGWTFLIGVILAVIFSFFQINAVISTILIIVGIIVGLLNIADEEVYSFLLSGTVLIIASGLGQSIIASALIFERMLSALLLIFVPAVIIVAIKNVFSLARH